jgi:hypothetical protein
MRPIGEGDHARKCSRKPLNALAISGGAQRRPSASPCYTASQLLLLLVLLTMNS